MPGFDHFNLIGPIYDLIFGRRVDLEIVDRAAVKPVHKVLDVGGGTGRVTVLFTRIAQKTVNADYARKMLYEAQEKGVDCVQTLSEKLPFDDRTFDRIIIVDALHHVVDQQRTLNEMWRLLTTGGKMIIEEPNIHHWSIKLIALGEKLLFMRSHFIKPERIASMCQFDPTAKVELIREKGIAWVIISKSNDTIERSNG